MGTSNSKSWSGDGKSSATLITAENSLQSNGDRSLKDIGALQPIALLQTSEEYFLQQKYNEALEEINKALAIDTNNALALDLKGRIFVAKGQYTEALPFFDLAIKNANSNDSQIKEMYWHLGLVYRELQQFENAHPALQQAITRDKKHARALNEEGLVYFAEGKFPEAYASFELAYQANPKEKALIVNEALALYRDGKTQNAIAVLNKIPKTDSNYVNAIINQCLIYFDQHQYDQALAILNKAIKNKPNSADLRAYRGLTFQKQRQFSKAHRAFDAALSIESENACAFNGLGQLCLDTYNLPNAAISFFNLATKVDPTNITYLGSKARAHVNLNQFNEAANTYEKILGLEPNHEFALSQLCDIYAEQKNWKKAIEDCERASKINPKETSYLIYRIYLLLKLKKYDEAFSELNKISTSPTDGLNYIWTRYYQSLIYKYQGKYEAAKTNLAEIIIENRDELQFDQLQFQKSQCMILWLKGEYIASLTLLDNIIKATKNYAAVNTKGYFLLLANQFDAADENFRLSLDLEAGNSLAWAGLGFVAFFKQCPSAKEHFNAAAKRAKMSPKAQTYARLGQAMIEARSSKTTIESVPGEIAVKAQSGEAIEAPNPQQEKDLYKSPLLLDLQYRCYEILSDNENAGKVLTELKTYSEYKSITPDKSKMIAKFIKEPLTNNETIPYGSSNKRGGSNISALLARSPSFRQTETESNYLKPKSSSSSLQFGNDS